MRILEAGWSALLVELDSPEQAQRAYAVARARQEEGRLAGVRELVPGARTLLLVVDAPVPAAAQALGRLGADIAGWDLDGPALSPGRHHELPVRYDGPDLDDVARRTGLTGGEVVALHTGRVHRVAFCGFAPGWAYVGGLPPALHLPRRATPRTSVPAGSLAIAGTYTGIYPTASPSGWNLLGHCAARLWDLDRDPPALLAPGDTVSFLEV